MSSSDIDKSSVILDNGSYTIKAGLGCDDTPDTPQKVIRNVVTSHGHVYVGEEALLRHKNENIQITSPMSGGNVTDWGSLEKVWRHVFDNELRVVPEEHPLLLTESPQGPKANRLKMTQTAFETFGVPAMYLAQQAVLALYTTGATTGTILNAGYQVTDVFPVYEGYALPHAHQRLCFGGQKLTEYLSTLLKLERQPREVINDIKERLCYVCMDAAAETRLLRQNAFRQSFLTWAVSNRRAWSNLTSGGSSSAVDLVKQVAAGQPKSVQVANPAQTPHLVTTPRNSVRHVHNVKRLIAALSLKVYLGFGVYLL